MKVSKLVLYSIGIVAENKSLKSRMVEITPIEDSPMIDGEITTNPTTTTTTTEDQSGSVDEVALTATNSIKAEWLPLGNSNRHTAPDVRRGERVVLYRFSDADKYYWITLTDDLRLRKLETVIFAFSGTQNEDANVEGDTTYFFEISTHKKLVHFHTSKADGEPFGYDIQINTKDGFIKITDDVGNYIQLDSSEQQLTIENVDGSMVDVNKREILVSAPDKITLKSKNIDVLADNAFTIKGATGTITANTLGITASTTHTGNINTAGGAGGAGDMGIAGAVNVGKALQVSGNMKAKKVTSTEAIEAPNV